MHIGIVVGEASGDILGASLMEALKQQFPHCRFSGIGGERMLAEGFESLYAQDRLAVMGFIEPLKRLPELLRIRKHLYQYFLAEKVDVVIGIDSPDFNLSLEKRLREQGIKTVHYVSPSVWAWRQGRIKLIKQAIDLMLTLLPFEAEFYHKHQVPVEFVGHPLADQFDLHTDSTSARHLLQTLVSPPNSTEQILEQTTLIACLPGSRHGEVERIGPAMWQAMAQLQQSRGIQLVIPALNETREQQIRQQLNAEPNLRAHIVRGHSHELMAAADCVVMASGTTTLEAMLLKKPMVVVYKKDALSYSIISRLIKVKHISLPNLLANERLVPELLQEQANANNIVRDVSYWLDNPSAVAKLQARFSDIHQQIRQNASHKAAAAITQLIDT